jgi:hypothetical protein
MGVANRGLRWLVGVVLSLICVRVEFRNIWAKALAYYIVLSPKIVVGSLSEGLAEALTSWRGVGSVDAG